MQRIEISVKTKTVRKSLHPTLCTWISRLPLSPPALRANSYMSQNRRCKAKTVQYSAYPVEDLPHLLSLDVLCEASVIVQQGSSRPLIVYKKGKIDVIRVERKHF